MLQYSEVSYREVDYSAVEEVIDEVFGFPRGHYSIPCGEEKGNDCEITVTVDGRLDGYDLERMKKAVETKELKHLDFGLQAAMNYCCMQGQIEPGEYLINISW